MIENFTPLPALLGGALIGLSATALLALNGRIAGISGLFGGLLAAPRESAWRLSFLLGMIGAGGLYYWLVPHPLVPRQDFSPWWLVCAGVLVGYGTRLGSGCTSGHGICGIGRLSPRSMVATAVFLGVGMLTAMAARPLFGLGA